MERNDPQCTIFICCFKRHHCGVFSQQTQTNEWKGMILSALLSCAVLRGIIVVCSANRRSWAGDLSGCTSAWKRRWFSILTLLHHRVAVLLIGRYFWCNFNRYALWVHWCLVIVVYSVTCLSCLWMSDVQRQVTNSKQFPFRFFSAYEVLQELEKSYHSSRKFQGFGSYLNLTLWPLPLAE